MSTSGSSPLSGEDVGWASISADMVLYCDFRPQIPNSETCRSSFHVTYFVYRGDTKAHAAIRTTTFTCPLLVVQKVIACRDVCNRGRLYVRMKYHVMYCSVTSLGRTAAVV